MFQTLIDEAAGGFGLGGKAGPFLGLLLARLYTPGIGSLASINERFCGHGLETVFDNWISNHERSALVMDDNAFRAAIGSDWLDVMQHRLDMPEIAIVQAGAHLLPRLVNHLGSAGRLPAQLPPEAAALIPADLDRGALPPAGA